MSYAVKEIYVTLQGEGFHAGRPAVFCRFAGCNLWSGREADRASAICRFCDTDFVGTDGPGGGRFATADALADAVRSARPADATRAFVVCTGGEPLLQLDSDLIAAFQSRDVEVGVESNGTIAAPAGIDWLTISPKAGADLVQTSGNELKLVYCQPTALPERFAGLAFEHFYLQPMDGPERDQHTRDAIAYCLAHPQWRLSVQTHKYIGIP